MNDNSQMVQLVYIKETNTIEAWHDWYIDGEALAKLLEQSPQRTFLRYEEKDGVNYTIFKYNPTICCGGGCHDSDCE